MGNAAAGVPLRCSLFATEADNGRKRDDAAAAQLEVAWRSQRAQPQAKPLATVPHLPQQT